MSLLSNSKLPCSSHCGSKNKEPSITVPSYHNIILVCQHECTVTVSVYNQNMWYYVCQVHGEYIIVLYHEQVYALESLVSRVCTHTLFSPNNV